MPEPSRIPLSQRPRAPQAAPQPQAKAQAAPAPKVKHHTIIHPFFAFLLWCAGLLIWCALSVGPAKYVEIRAMREAMYAEPEYATVAFHEPDEALGAPSPTPAGCSRNPGGGLSCEPASAPAVKVERVPAITDLRLAAIAVNTMPWTVQILPGLVSAAIAYVGGSLMLVLCLLLGSRRG